MADRHSRIASNQGLFRNSAAKARAKSGAKASETGLGRSPSCQRSVPTFVTLATPVLVGRSTGLAARLPDAASEGLAKAWQRLRSSPQEDQDQDHDQDQEQVRHARMVVPGPPAARAALSRGPLGPAATHGSRRRLTMLRDVMHPEGPLLVFGPRSPTYDFGPSHPLTPRRFGPGIELLESVGAKPGLAPEPAADEELLLSHTARYVAAVKRLSRDPGGPPEAGMGHAGDNPSFEGMHQAAAAVAGGSLRAIEAILRGDVQHAFHPGGGLHHAMRDRASGFCIYDDPALAIARARQAGLRVLYVDLDVHHGDGVQALFEDDPGVLTISFHESGRYLFPGTGFANELGEGEAAGTSVNLPFEPWTGESVWLPAVEALVPALSAAFGPDLVVSQHGADSHAWDPLAHLRMTTTAMGAAARLVDRVAHRHAGGRWLSTGGGGYDAYRVVPRSWSHVWLAGAHREPPGQTPVAWRERWASEAARYGQAPLPATFDDAPNAGEEPDRQQLASEGQSRARVAAVEAVVVPALLRAAMARAWWSPLDGQHGGAGTRAGAGAPAAPRGAPAILPDVDLATLERLRLAERVIPPADAPAAHELLRSAVESGGASVAAAVVGDVIVGVAVSGGDGAEGDALLTLGVTPTFRRQGLGRALLAAIVDGPRTPQTAVVTVAERDPVEPLPVGLRATIARRLLAGAGFTLGSPVPEIARIDRDAIAAERTAG